MGVGEKFRKNMNIILFVFFPTSTFNNYIHIFLNVCPHLDPMRVGVRINVWKNMNRIMWVGVEGNIAKNMNIFLFTF